MSYGEVYIQSDLKKMTIKEVAMRLHTYYPDISFKRAYKLVSHIKKHGIDVVNPYWKKSKTEELREKRKLKAMKEFNLVERSRD